MVSVAGTAKPTGFRAQGALGEAVAKVQDAPKVPEGEATTTQEWRSEE